MVDPDKAQAFADALTALCRRHGMMVWTSYETAPIMLTEAHEGDNFRYEAEPGFGNCMVISRRLLPTGMPTAGPWWSWAWWRDT